MLTVPTQRVFSNPTSTLPRLLEIYKDIAPLEVRNKKKPGKRDSLLIEASHQASDARIKGSMEAYREYEEMLFKKLKSANGIDLYVLNGTSPDRTQFSPYKWGVDIFHPMHFISEKAWLGTIDKLLGIARVIKPSATIDNILGNHFVMSGQITDWPGVTVEDDAGIKVRHPYVEDIRNVERILGKKRGFGTLEKRLNDQVPKIGNSQYSEGILSFSDFKAIRDAIPDLDIDQIEEIGSREAFYEQARQYIHLIRETIIGKTAEFMQQLNPENVYLFSMLTSPTTDIWKRAAKSSGIGLKLIGGDSGPLGNSSRTALAELDPSSIRLLEGALMNNYHKRTGHRLQIPFRIAVPEKMQFEIFSHCPYGSPWNLCNVARYCGGPQDCLTGDENKLDAFDREIVRNFALENKSGILPVEGLFYLLNQRDNLLGVDPNYWKSWTADKQGKALVPLQLPIIPEVADFDIRASELTYPLDTIDALTKTKKQIISEDQRKLEEIAVHLRRGTLVHDLMLGGTQEVYHDLLHPEFRIPRNEYCDQEGQERRHLVWYFKPSSNNFDAVEEKLLKLERKYDVDGILELLDSLREKKPTILISGHADAAAQLYTPDIALETSPIVAIDVKTSMASNYPRTNIINQLLVYTQAIKQLFNILDNPHTKKQVMEGDYRKISEHASFVKETARTTDTFYTIPVYTRFNANRLLPPEKRDLTDYGIFMKQRPAPVKVTTGSNRMQEMQNRILELYIAKIYVGLIPNK